MDSLPALGPLPGLVAAVTLLPLTAVVFRSAPLPKSAWFWNFR